MFHFLKMNNSSGDLRCAPCVAASELCQTTWVVKGAKISKVQLEPLACYSMSTKSLHSQAFVDLPRTVASVLEEPTQACKVHRFLLVASYGFSFFLQFSKQSQYQWHKQHNGADRQQRGAYRWKKRVCQQLTMTEIINIFDQKKTRTQHFNTTLTYI